jgi:hypothetical protein
LFCGDCLEGTRLIIRGAAVLCSECNTFVRRILPAMAATRSLNNGAAYSMVASFTDTRIRTGNLSMAKDLVSDGEAGSSRGLTAPAYSMVAASDSSRGECPVPVIDSRPTRSLSASLPSQDEGSGCGLLIDTIRPLFTGYEDGLRNGQKSIRSRECSGDSDNHLGLEVNWGPARFRPILDVTDSSDVDICQFQRVPKRGIPELHETGDFSNISPAHAGYSPETTSS